MHPRFVMLISWARYIREKAPGFVIRKCVAAKSSVRLSWTTVERSGERHRDRNRRGLLVVSGRRASRRVAVEFLRFHVTG